MLKNKFNKWFYNGVNVKDWLVDFGYYIGYKICEDYYSKVKDKDKVLIYIIRMKNYKCFLKKSGYVEKWIIFLKFQLI